MPPGCREPRRPEEGRPLRGCGHDRHPPRRPRRRPAPPHHLRARLHHDGGGLVPRHLRRHPGAVHRVDRRGRAAVDARQGQGLGHRRVLDAARARRPSGSAARSRTASRPAAPRRSSASSAARCGRCATCARWASARSSSTATCSRPTAAPARPRSAAATSPCTTRSPAWCRPGAIAQPPARPRSAPPSPSASSTGSPVLDLPYVEDSRAEVDMNVVMTSLGGFVEVQGTAEGAPYSRAELDSLLGAGRGRHRRDHRAAAARWSASPRRPADADPAGHGQRPQGGRGPGDPRSRPHGRGPGHGGRGDRRPPSRRTRSSRRGRWPRPPASWRWPTTPASRSTTSTARPGSTRPGGPATATGSHGCSASSTASPPRVGPAATCARPRPCGPTAVRSWCAARSRASWSTPRVATAASATTRSSRPSRATAARSAR